MYTPVGSLINSLHSTYHMFLHSYAYFIHYHSTPVLVYKTAHLGLWNVTSLASNLHLSTRIIYTRYVVRACTVASSMLDRL